MDYLTAIAPESLEVAAAHILGLGVRLTVITKGAEGSQFTSPGITIRRPGANPPTLEELNAAVESQYAGA